MIRNIAVLLVIAISSIAGATNFSEVSVTTGLPAWNREISSPFECRKAKEILNVLICGWTKQVEMNRVLNRVASYISGIVEQPGVIVNQQTAEFKDALNKVAGHDLKGSELMQYWQEMSEACERKPALCPSEQEKHFFETVVKPLYRQGEFVVITYALKSVGGWEEVATHEILHAQYYIQENFRNTVDGYWHDENNFMPGEKDLIRTLLGAHYDRSNDLLMRNEFQAYILMADAEKNLLHEFVARHRPRMLAILLSAGQQPIQVSTATSSGGACSKILKSLSGLWTKN